MLAAIVTYRLSLLDKSPIPEGAHAAAALRHTVAQAQRAEALGYHRYWLAEHHASPLLAGSAPEVLVAYLLARTSRIRIGSGGVMLQHYSAYKVAEVFKVLAALAPGRVDLGVGKAPGGLPLSTRALQAYHDAARKPGFEEQLMELDGFLRNQLPAAHPLAEAVATPVPPLAPSRFLLGGSVQSAQLAARHGWQFVYAGHFNGDPVNIEQSLRAYADASGRKGLLAVYAFAAETEEAAQTQVGALRSYRLHLPDGRSVNLATLEAAAEFARQAGHTAYRTEERLPQVIAGTPEQVRAELDALSRRHGVDEFVIDTPVPGFAERRASIELLAGATQTVEA